MLSPQPNIKDYGKFNFDFQLYFTPNLPSSNFFNNKFIYLSFFLEIFSNPFVIYKPSENIAIIGIILEYYIYFFFYYRRNSFY